MHRTNLTAIVISSIVAGVFTGCVPSYEGPEGLGEASSAFLSNRSTTGEWEADVPGSPARILLQADDGSYRLSLDGTNFSRPFPQKPLIRMRSGTLDPIAADPLELIPARLQSSLEMLDMSGEKAYIVQFVAQPLPVLQDHLRAMGVKFYAPIPDHAFVVHMDAAAAAELNQLSFVRWVGYYHSGFKLDESLVTTAVDGGSTARYSIMVMDDTPSMKSAVANRIEELGGATDALTTSRRMVASFDGHALGEIAKLKEVVFIDRYTPPEDDVDVARQIGGASRLESIRGYTGQGVRGEVMDGGLRVTHDDFQFNSPVIHAGNSASTSHGTSVYGLVFGNGASDPKARGFLPDAEQPIFAAYSTLGDRMAHTARLVDPAGPYRAVFQTNSWGGGRTLSYNTVSAEMDDILFTHDILILQSQSNAGNQDSRPQAWAKNILSVGGVRHFDTLDRVDDQWNNSASIGPASDGRIKPDVWHFYDDTWAPSSTSDTAHREFGGTSGATPVTAGHMGLLFQMWADGVFAGGPGLGRDVFDSRPHMTTAKALLVNSAFQYPFVGTADDKTRVHQGWGMADVGNLYDVAEANAWSLPILIDESAVLLPTAIHTYSVTVDGSSPLKATLVYADPAGTPSASRHRVNDLSLRATSPSGVIYWGNNGLLTGVWSTAGGTSNDIDTVENVFIQTPEVGSWTIEVLGDEILVDSHVETPAVDADYALVVTHVVGGGGGNTPPTLNTIGDRTVAEGDTLSFIVTATDPDGDPITYSANPLPANATLDSVSGAFSFTPSSNQAGTYAVTFSADDGRGGAPSETITITVTDVPASYTTIPYTADFEAATLDPFWETTSSLTVGRIRLASTNNPRGAQHLMMDVSVDNNLNTNEAWLHLDLTGETQVDLSFWWKEFSDEDHVEDGVFLSDDAGATFVKVRDLTGGSATYTNIELDLDQLAASNGLTLSSTFVVKFQQRDNYAISTDGMAFDDISVTTGAPPNVAPVLSAIGDRAMAEGETLTIALSATDADGDPITYSSSTLPANASLDSATGAFSFSPSGTQAGTYTVTFTASDDRGGSDSETITISVTSGSYATLPYFKDFENGVLGQYWTSASSLPVGRIQIGNTNNPRGTRHLMMDVSSNNNMNTNEARLHLDLSGETQVDLRFWWKEFSDETHVEDGVFLSDDAGATFVKVQDLSNGSATYQEIALDIDQLASTNGLTLSSTFIVKFQQHDNYMIDTDGMAFDDIRVTSGGVGGCTTIHANDFESGAGGWSFIAAESTCTTGAWVVGDPDAVTTDGIFTQPEDDHTGAPGVNAFFTAPNVNGIGTDDVDGGVCTGRSGIVDASAYPQVQLSFWYYHGQRDAGDDPTGDFFSIDLSSDGGATFGTNIVSIGDVTTNAGWTQINMPIFNPGQMVLRIQASDGAGPGDLVEGGIDDLVICVPQ